MQCCNGIKPQGSDSEGRHAQGVEGGSRRPSGSAPDVIGVSGGYDEYRAPLEDSDHLAVHSVHIFMQNLYHYATQNTVSLGLRWVHHAAAQFLPRIWRRLSITRASG